MSTGLHKDLAVVELHRAQSLTFADATARGAYAATADDVGRICFQTDTQTFYILEDDSPLTWGEIGGGVALASTVPADVTKAAAAVGTGTTAARDDHKHDVSTAAAVANNPGSSNAEGSATSLARSDHTHSLHAYGSSANTICQGNDSRLSDSRPPTGSAGGDLTGTYPNPTVAADAVTNAKLANMAQATIKGRASGAGTGDPTDLTSAQATAILDAFTSALKGLAPASGGGTTNFLRADGTWAAPPGGVSGCPHQMFQADQLESPNSSDWAVNALAPLIPDATNTALSVRAFDDTTDEGVGFTVRVPDDATNMILGFLGRAATAPGSAQTVSLALYSRAVPDNAVIPAWSSATALTDLSIPTNAYYQKDSQTIAISTLGLTAGVTYTFELIRDNNGTLTGDYLLHSLTVGWS